MGYAMHHPNGGPELGLRLDPARRGGSRLRLLRDRGPAKADLDELASRLTAQGEQHAGVHFASIGWILPELHDPDGHEIRFYTMESHSPPDFTAVTTVHDPRETGHQRESQWACTRTDG